MTPKEKAIELYSKYYNMLEHTFNEAYFSFTKDIAKQCALIAVDEIMKSEPTEPLNGGYFELHSDMIDEAIKYWQEVKQEIEKI